MPKTESLPTQQFIDVSEIKEDGTVILKNGGLRRLLMVSGVSFELKSDEEQDFIIHNFQRFLNTLDFSVQVIIHSRRINVEGYLENLRGLKEKEPNELLRNLLDEYAEFVRSLVETRAVTAKNFFVVVPYDPLQIAPPSEWSLLKFFKKDGGEEEKKKELLRKSLEENIFQLNQRAAQVMDGLAQIGLRAVALNARESLELFYNFYNPETTEKRELKIAQEL